MNNWCIYYNFIGGNTKESQAINTYVLVCWSRQHTVIYTHTPHTVLTVWRPGRTPVDSGCRSPPSTPFPAASSAVYPASVASVWSSAMLNTPPSLPRPAMQKIWIKIWIFYPQLSKPFTKHLHTTHLFSSLLLAVFTVCVGKLFC